MGPYVLWVLWVPAKLQRGATPPSVMVLLISVSQSLIYQVRTWIDETIAASGGAAPCNSTSGEKISGFKHQHFLSLELHRNMGRLGLVERVLGELQRRKQESREAVPLRRRGRCLLPAL